MILNRVVLSCVLSVTVLAATANAVDIHTNDFESETMAGFGIAPMNMSIVGAGGALNNPNSYGISNSAPYAGSYNYVTDVTPTGTDAWGSTWLGASSTGRDGANSAGLVSKDDALANGTNAMPLSYLDIEAGDTFTISAQVATDATDPVTGQGHANVHLELKDATGAVTIRTDNTGTAPKATSAGGVGGTGSIAFPASGGYALLTETYTITAADITAGVVEVAAVLATDMGGGTAGDGSVGGKIFFDDFVFSTTADVVTVVPEPGSLAMVLVGALALLGIRRRS